MPPVRRAGLAPACEGAAGSCSYLLRAAAGRRAQREEQRLAAAAIALSAHHGSAVPSQSAAQADTATGLGRAARRAETATRRMTTSKVEGLAKAQAASSASPWQGATGPAPTLDVLCLWAHRQPERGKNVGDMGCAKAGQAFRRTPPPCAVWGGRKSIASFAVYPGAVGSQGGPDDAMGHMGWNGMRKRAGPSPQKHCEVPGPCAGIRVREVGGRGLCRVHRQRLGFVPHPSSCNEWGRALCRGPCRQSWSATQGRVARSSAEAEVYAIMQANREGLGAQRLLRVGADLCRDPLRRRALL